LPNPTPSRSPRFDRDCDCGASIRQLRKISRRPVTRLALNFRSRGSGPPKEATPERSRNIKIFGAMHGGKNPSLHRAGEPFRDQVAANAYASTVTSKRTNRIRTGKVTDGAQTRRRTPRTARVKGRPRPVERPAASVSTRHGKLPLDCGVGLPEDMARFASSGF